MIYRLPTKGSIRYRGAYPHNARSISASNGEVHVELNNNERLVMRSCMLLDLPRYGKDFRRYLRDQGSIAVNLNYKMYADLLAAAQLRNQKVDRRAVTALLAKWDNVFSAEIG